MRLTECDPNFDYLIARNNMLQDTTVATGAVALNTLVEMPQAVEIGTWAIAAAFALSAVRFAAYKSAFKHRLRNSEEW